MAWWDSLYPNLLGPFRPAPWLSADSPLPPITVPMPGAPPMLSRPVGARDPAPMAKPEPPLNLGFFPEYFEPSAGPGVRMPGIYADESGIAFMPRRGHAPPIPQPPPDSSQRIPGNTSASLMPLLPGIGPFMRGNGTPQPVADGPRASPSTTDRRASPATSSPEPGVYQENTPDYLAPGAYYGMRVDNPAFKQPPLPDLPKQPSWYDRNKEWITMASRDLGALGRGMLQAPPGYNAFGQGFAKVIDDRETRIDTDLKRQLLKAQVGKVEAEAQTREWAKQLYADTRIPMPVRMAAIFKPESIPELMKELDGPTQALLAKYAAAKAGLVAGATERAKLAPDIVSAEANRAGLIESAKTAATGGNTQLAKLYHDRDNARAKGDFAKARSLQAEIDKEAAQSEKAQADAVTSAANIKAAQTARQDFEGAVSYFINPKTGQVNPEIRSQGLIPWSDARNQYAALRQAAINFASAKGGKALTEPEIKMYIEPNLPGALDNDAGIKMKLDRLRRYLDSVGGTSTATPGAQRYRMGTDGAIR